MKTLSTLTLFSAVLLLAGCDGGSSSNRDPRASEAKPPLKQPIPDSPPTGIGVSSSTEIPAGVTKGPKKK
ncbi:MAG: hypothetical protein EXS01_07260 [Phycisphaerales bacterium]|nr:hypothetical protein [Phycisphaerales bacterium]